MRRAFFNGRFGVHVLVAATLALVAVVLVTSSGPAGADQPPGGEEQDYGNNYVLLDSTDAGGPVFNSPVYSPSTIAMELVDQDDEYEEVPIGFNFDFYGSTYDDAYLSSNGFISFGGGNTDYEGFEEPLSTNGYGDDPAAFGYWTDLDPVDECSTPPLDPVKYGTYGTAGTRVFVAEWLSCANDYGNNEPADYIRFQIRLFEADNAIEYHYFDVEISETENSFGDYTTVGLRNGDPGQAYLQYSFDEVAIDNSMAIRLWQPECNGVVADVVGTRADDMLTAPLWGGGSTYGHTGNDVLQGSSFDDYLCGAEGRDEIRGYDGADIIYGGDDQDTMYGYDGDDEIYAGEGNDVAYGGNDDDFIGGGGGIDRLYGQAGMDDIRGGIGDDRLFGGTEDDLMYGQTGVDSMYGQTGDDEMYGGTENDRMYGGRDDDDMWGDSGDDLMYGQDGTDDMYGGNDVDRIYGNIGNDYLYGDAGNDLVYGMAGDDYLYGGDDMDSVYGGGGADFLYGDDDDDNLYGQGGSDTLDGGAGVMDLCNGGIGTDAALLTCETIQLVP